MALWLDTIMTSAGQAKSTKCCCLHVQLDLQLGVIYVKHFCRRIANRESARRVRRKRQNALEDMQV